VSGGRRAAWADARGRHDIDIGSDGGPLDVGTLWTPAVVGGGVAWRTRSGPAVARVAAGSRARAALETFCARVVAALAR
jgi:hypothetical protein